MYTPAHREEVCSRRADAGDAPDGADVLGDVLADRSVALRRRADELAVLVDDLDGEPVELRLAEVVD